MRVILTLLLICSASLVVGCSSFPKSTQELEKRAGYGLEIPGSDKRERPNRKKQRVEEVTMTGRMLPSGDWFIGGRLLLVVNEPDWIFEDPKLKAAVK